MRRFDPAFQRGLKLRRLSDTLAFHALAIGKLHEIDIRIGQASTALDQFLQADEMISPSGIEQREHLVCLRKTAMGEGELGVAGLLFQHEVGGGTQPLWMQAVDRLPTHVAVRL